MKKTIKLLRESISDELMKDLAFGVLASFVLALFAPLSFHLPFTPVPITIQVQVALFLSAFLGARRALFMVLAFISQGLIGLPVFAGGASSVATLLGPRGGYLFGYFVASFVVGKLYQSTSRKTSFTLFFAMLVGNVIVYLCGFSWLSNFIGFKKAFLLGIAPFALLDFFKLAMFSFLKTPVASFLNSLCKKS